LVTFQRLLFKEYLIQLDNLQDVGLCSARYIIDKINQHSPASERPFVLGLPTRNTPLKTYQFLIKLHKE